MLRRYLAGLVFVGSAALAMAQEQSAPPTNLMPTFTGQKAVGPAGAAPNPTSGVRLTPVFTMPALQQPKPTPGWELKPEHGEWFIEIKSYAQVESGLMAEALAKEIRDTYKQPVYLYEWGAEARKKRDEEEATARKRMEEELRPFLEFQAKLKAEAEARGEEFIPAELKAKVPVYYREIPDQYMVVLGGYKDLDTARKALDVVRRWPAPKDTRLLDSVETAVVKDGKNVYMTTYVNPFAEARVVRNMTLPKQQVSLADEFLVKLNQGEPLSIMKSPKKWTLKVKTFNAPVTKAGQEAQSSSVRSGPTAGTARPGQWLDATAQQAEMFCKALRNLKDREGRYVGFDAFLLHHRTGTIVTVGQYDSPDDPVMQDDLRRIQAMSFNKLENNRGNPGGALGFDKQVQFEGVYPIMIPK